MKSNMRLLYILSSALLFFSGALAVSVTEGSTAFTFANNWLSFNVLKKNGYIQALTYDNVSTLGTVSGNAGQVYTDFPSAIFALTSTTTHQIVNGSDWAGIILTDNDTLGSIVQRSWFIRDNEPGLHSFVRLAYYNQTVSKGELGEVRTMFRPNSGPWSHIITNNEQWAPLPAAAAVANEVVAQDATWYLGNTPDDPYVVEESDYFTKYTFADNQTNKAHGLYGAKPDGTPLGAWWVVNQKDTFFGGPTHIDLMVDGIIYNKQSTTHGGATNPNISYGFDRTFGPQFLYFNQGKNKTLFDLLADAESLAAPSWNANFYDEIAPYVIGYVPSSGRGTFSAKVTLPKGATKPLAVLSANGVHFQDSAQVPSAYQYWAEIVNGQVSIPRVKAGTYRLTVFANGIFGDYIQDNVVVHARKTTILSNVVWKAESAGKELWRIGIPDKTSGEFRNGWERDLTHPNHPSKYRIYWGAWDFGTQFPNGVNYTIGKSHDGVDWNYIHWSVFGPSYTRNNSITSSNNWTINFELDSIPKSSSLATFTIQLAGAKTTSGNTDVASGSNPNFNISTYVNSQSNPLNWEIQWFESSSCGERSGGFHRTV
ncbi:galactose mutarotase-like protein [Punctularia strigosozonata HHB-11173 SS5]|uniref:galactose mutarotase-like protein n=1 Tax=Punctularia strigosozonata (strain HHB-11173) TaxID=741275 RepID=UPI0004418079|nr:galactose mutarotase-like protein [Punctularia strigosozonata HHB-11173 SS5]EIN10187.1 galactose mutarotase-like protein [Punctularia strigosozonata HHB-11173 SS5]